MTSSGTMRGTKQLKKLLANEAKTDLKNLGRAQKELQKAEKAYTKSIKATQKVRKQVDQAVKASQKTANSLETAQHNHNDAANKLDKAERDAKEARDKEARLEKDVSSYQDCLSNVHRGNMTNDDDRERRKAEAFVKSQRGETDRIAENTNLDVAPAPVSVDLT